MVFLRNTTICALFVGLAAGVGCGGGTPADAGVEDTGPRRDVIILERDAGPDAGPRDDTGPGVDMGITAIYGGPCRNGMCLNGTCTTEIAGSAIGSANDPIRVGDAGGSVLDGSVTSSPIFKDGLCSPAVGVCRPNLPEAQDMCGAGASCISLGRQGTTDLNWCFADCRPVGNGQADPCRAGFNCDLQVKTCIPFVCASNEECRISRIDGNGDGLIQAPTTTPAAGFAGLGTACNGERVILTDGGVPDGGVPDGGAAGDSGVTDDSGLDAGAAADLGAPDAGPAGDAGPGRPCDTGMACDPTRRVCVPKDPLVYDAASTATCNANSRRCEGGGSATARPGDTCQSDATCEPDAVCYTQRFSTTNELLFPGGLCSKFGCELPGRACAGGAESTCQNLGSTDDPTNLCLKACTVGMEPADQRTGAPRDTNGDGTYETGGRGAGCRPGYMCLPNTTAANGSGGCFLGNYNDITANNIGEECPTNTANRRDDLCYSPYGAGSCLALGSALTMQGAPTSYCTIVNCNTENGYPADVCGAGSVCNTTLFSDGTGLCLETCTNASSCPTNWGCIALDPMNANDKSCFPTCMADTDCRTGQTCRTDTMNRRYCQ